MMKRSLLALTLLLIGGITAFAQLTLSTKSKRAIELYTEADNYRVRGQYTQAIALLQEALDKDKEFVEAWYRLGLIHMSMKKFQEAAQDFERGLSYTSDIKKQKVFWFDLGETYFTLGDYDKAEKLISDFLVQETVNKQRIDRAKRLLQNIRFARDNRALQESIKQRVLSDTINQFVKQYFPVLTADQQSIIFTRRKGFSDNFDEDLVISSKDKQGRWTLPASISANINTENNEGTCTISADGRKLIFTACSGREGFGSCDLYESERIGTEWTKPKNLGINVNSADWESQPSLSADGRTLYFVSDRKGGLGRRDIWITTRNAIGEWTKAKNVGKPVNTVYDEISPFIHVNNRTLYFASSGLTGFGGYDIFFSEKDSAFQWAEPINMGAPVNNHEDQFSLFITADGKKGYYSHEELLPNGHASSKIYEMEIPLERRMKFRSNYVKGTVTDRETKQPLAATIEMINLKTNEVESLIKSDSISGDYLIVLTQGSQYALYVNKTSYLFKSLNFNYSEVEDFEPIVVDIELDKIKEGSVAVLRNIFFEFDKFDIKPESITELQKVLKLLNDNPKVNIEISGHTDNQGSREYNKQLSDKRALSVKQYLIKQGVSERRIRTAGYGPDQPIASNETPDGQAQNRRIEFKIIK